MLPAVPLALCACPTVPVSLDVNKIFKKRLVIKEIRFLGLVVLSQKATKFGAAITFPNLL
jgi:hypothetical protein